MRKAIFVIAALIFGFGVLATSVYQTSTKAVSNNLETESLEFEVAEEATEEADEEAEKTVDYALVWPGILPDHFLYPVKMLRDRIWLFLTTDSLKKAELLLKYADKRIWAAQMLVEKEKADLGVTTATKAEKYLERAVNQAKVAQEEEKDVTAFWEKLSLASQKHEEVLLAMQKTTGDSLKGALEGLLDYPQKALEEAKGRLSE